jgi:hypothetical protein
MDYIWHGTRLIPVELREFKGKCVGLRENMAFLYPKVEEQVTVAPEIEGQEAVEFDYARLQ